MAQEIQDPGHGGGRRIFYSALCLLLPLPIPIIHKVFGVFTFAQVSYGELGIVAALLSYLMVAVKPGWGKLLAAQAIVILGFAPRLALPISTGVPDMTLPELLYLAMVPGVFTAVLLAIHGVLERRGGSHTRYFVQVMCVVALCIHAIVLPILLGEPLRSHILQVAVPGEEIIQTNPDGTFLLTHTALSPVQATLYARRDGQLDLLRKEALAGYPVGIRVRDDHALIALRVQNEEKVVERIDFVRLSRTGLEAVSSFPCAKEQNPSHLINNLSPDGQLLALADGAFVDVATGGRRELLHGDSNPDGRLLFVQWTEPEGRAVYYHEGGRRLLILDTGTGTTDTHTLRGNPESASVVSVLPGGQKVWYEETPLFTKQAAFVENLSDQKRTRIFRRQGKARHGSVLLWTGEQRLTYITALGTLDSLNFDHDRKRFQWERHTQLMDVTAEVTFAGKSNWLFWVTQAPHGEGTAIHGEKLR